jgi:AraC family transcriptional regulator
VPPLRTSTPDPLAIALARKARSGEPGTNTGTVVATGASWKVVDIVCTSGPRDPSFVERQASVCISLVLSGTFLYRTDRRSSLMSAGALILGNAEQPFECSHEHGEGDRCLSFQFDPELFARLAYDAGAPRFRFDRDRLPPLRPLAPLTTRARMATARGDSLEEIGLDLAAAVIHGTANGSRTASAASGDPGRIARVLRCLEAATAERHALSDLARTASLSPYHFLRVFKAVTGVTPHQWILRARLREAAHRLVTSRVPVTEIALEVGFDDLSNFIRTFRAEFGVPPSRYRGRSDARI